MLCYLADWYQHSGQTCCISLVFLSTHSTMKIKAAGSSKMPVPTYPAQSITPRTLTAVRTSNFRQPEMEMRYRCLHVTPCPCVPLHNIFKLTTNFYETQHVQMLLNGVQTSEMDETLQALSGIFCGDKIL